MRCAACGAQLNPGERFCDVCGQVVEATPPLPPPPPVTTTPLPPPPAIPLPPPPTLAPRCPRCQWPAEAGDQFCGTCGQPLAGGMARPVPPAAPLAPSVPAARQSGWGCLAVGLPVLALLATAVGVIESEELASLLPPAATPAAEVRATLVTLLAEPARPRLPAPPVLIPRTITKVAATTGPTTSPARGPTGTPRPAAPGVPPTATPVALTRPPATGLVIQETFDTPDRGVLPRDVRQPDVYRHDYERGEFVLRVSDTNRRPTTLAIVPGEFAHTSMSVDARLVGETSGRFVALGCRAYVTSEYRLTLAVAAGQFALDRFDAGQPVSLVAWRAAPPPPAGATAHRLALRCVGGQITASINGVQVASARDTTYTSGALWLGTGRFTNGPPGAVEARFDNLVVTREAVP